MLIKYKSRNNSLNCFCECLLIWSISYFMLVLGFSCTLFIRRKGFPGKGVTLDFVQENSDSLIWYIAKLVRVGGYGDPGPKVTRFEGRETPREGGGGGEPTFLQVKRLAILTHLPARAFSSPEHSIHLDYPKDCVCLKPSARCVFSYKEVCLIWKWVRESRTSDVGAVQRSRSLAQSKWIAGSGDENVTRDKSVHTEHGRNRLGQFSSI